MAFTFLSYAAYSSAVAWQHELFPGVMLSSVSELSSSLLSLGGQAADLVSSHMNGSIAFEKTQ